MIGLLLLAAAIPLDPSAEAAAALEAPQGPQGDSWASIAQLPDWSGVWALTLAGHLAASDESAAHEKLGGNIQQSLTYCLPAGVPGIMLHTIQLEFLFTPGRVTLLTENGEVRRIYISRRTHLNLDDLMDSYEGDSIGHWEGKTLVVDTIGFPKGTLWANGPLRATINTHYVERIALKDQEHIQIDSVIDDPKLFNQPYAASRVYERLGPAFPMQEPQCNQTNRDDGTHIDLTPPPE